MENQKNENQKIEIELGRLVIGTYNRIALWTQGDFDNDKQKSDALKIVSQDIVQNALEEFSRVLNVKGTTEVYRGDVRIGDSETIKDSESFTKVSEKDVFDKLFIKDEPKQ